MADYTNEARRIAQNLANIATELQKLNAREEKRDTQRAFDKMAR